MLNYHEQQANGKVEIRPSELIAQINANNCHCTEEEKSKPES